METILNCRILLCTLLWKKLPFFERLNWARTVFFHLFIFIVYIEAKGLQFLTHFVFKSFFFFH